MSHIIPKPRLVSPFTQTEDVAEADHGQGGSELSLIVEITAGESGEWIRPASFDIKGQKRAMVFPHPKRCCRNLEVGGDLLGSRENRSKPRKQPDPKAFHSGKGGFERYIFTAYESDEIKSTPDSTQNEKLQVVPTVLLSAPYGAQMLHFEMLTRSTGK